MTEQELLKFCHYYKGESIIPPSFDKKNEGKLWVAEKAICEDFSNLVGRNNPKRRVAELVAAYVSKWSPYSFRSVMNTYFEKSPELKGEIMAIYN